MVSVQLLGLTPPEIKTWLKKKYPKPLEIVLNNRYGEYDFTCMEQHGWCVDWDGCPDLYRCAHGKRQSQINWPSPEQAMAMTPEERIAWQKRNFPKKVVPIKIPDVGTSYCIIYGWCIKEQSDNCIYTHFCTEYWENKPKWKEVKQESEVSV